MKAIRVPSGDHEGSMSSTPLGSSGESRRSPVPSADTTWMAPFTSKAIREPSGDHEGDGADSAATEVTAVTFDPSASIRYTSYPSLPLRAKAILVPSADQAALRSH